MGYMLPLKFIRVSDQMSICATRIVAIMSTKAYQARRLIKSEKQADTLLNASGKSAVRTAIILDNGAVVASPYSIQKLLTNISKADAKSSNAKTVRLSNGLKLYDVIPDEIAEGLVEETAEIEADDSEENEEWIEIEDEESMEDDEDSEENDEDLDICKVQWDGEVNEE